MDKIPSIRELRKICQEPVWNYENPYTKFFYRKVSIYFTKLLLHTFITANQATLISLAFGLLGVILFSLQYYLFGALMFPLSILFDCIDGEIARYRRTSSIKGVYLDVMTHYIIDSSIFVGLSIGVFRAIHNPLILEMGMISAVSIMFSRIIRDAPYIAAREIKTEVNADEVKEESKFVKYFLPYNSDNVPYFILLLHLVVFFVPKIDVVFVLTYVLIFYGITFPLVCVVWMLKCYSEL